MYPGQQITERLRLVSQLGKGGMGSVWVAHHLTLDTQVAVKFASAELGATEAGMARFEREARAAAKLNSPHVIKISDYGRTMEGVPFISMELLPGSNLSDFFQEYLTRYQRPLPPELACHIIEQAARGLEAAHAVGLVHRDIKPENLFISEVGGEPFVRLLDFGIVKDTANTAPGLTGTWETFGTPYTMSPEQIRDPKQVDYRTDLWSLAVVAYHVLTAAWPFDCDSPALLFIRIHEGVFKPPTSLRPELPPTLDAWFLRALAQDPAQRFASARELSQSLSAALGSQPPTAVAFGSLPPTAVALTSQPPTAAVFGSQPPTPVALGSQPPTPVTLASQPPTAVEQPGAADATSTPPRAVAQSADTMSAAISTQGSHRERSRGGMRVILGAASLVLAVGLGAFFLWPSDDSTEAVPGASTSEPRELGPAPGAAMRQPAGVGAPLPSAAAPAAASKPSPMGSNDPSVARAVPEASSASLATAAPAGSAASSASPATTGAARAEATSAGASRRAEPSTAPRGVAPGPAAAGSARPPAARPPAARPPTARPPAARPPAGRPSSGQASSDLCTKYGIGCQ